MEKEAEGRKGVTVETSTGFCVEEEKEKDSVVWRECPNCDEVLPANLLNKHACPYCHEPLE